MPKVLQLMKRLPIFWVSALTVAFCIAAVALTQGVITYRNTIDLVVEELRLRGVEATNLVAHQSGAALQSGEVEALSDMLFNVQASSGGDVLTVVAVPINGEFVVEIGAGSAEAIALAERAAQSGKPEMSEDGLKIAVPTRVGETQDVVGAVALSWSADRTIARARADELQAALISVIATLLSILGAMAFLRYYLSRPLLQACDSIDKLSSGQFDIKLDVRERTDEIGYIHRSLATFGDNLKAAEGLRKEALYKGSAFENSSTALMLIDQSFNIRTLNSAAKEMFVEHQEAFERMRGTFDPDALIGSNVSDFHADPEHVTKILNAPDSLPFEADVRMGAAYFNISINSITNAEGQHSGFVMEWAHVTKDRLNAAILETLDADQAIAEFDLEGKLITANTNFRNLFDAVGMGPLAGKPVDILFDLSANQSEDAPDFVAGLVGGEARYGKFATLPGNGTVAVLEGSFSTVRDREGHPTQLILIGKNVTGMDREIAQSRKQQEEMQAVQAGVVDALRVALRRIREGDLTAQITAEFGPEYDELKSDFNAALTSFSQAMQLVIENAATLRGETAEISKSADTLSGRTESNAATLAESAASLDQLTNLVNTAAKSADQANGVVANARERAMQSGEIVQETVSAMSQIEESSGKIVKIIDVIEDIAFQTNLLALNAGVEAARAGEAGRGFAVVASEVRALAQRSSDAAREINTLISSSGVQVSRGVDLVAKTGSALEDIVRSIGEISDLVAGIAASANEQSVGVSEINTAVNQLDQATQQYTAMFEETSAASRALADVARTLDQAVERFKTGGPTGLAVEPAPVPADQPQSDAPPMVMVAGGMAEPAYVDDADWEEF